MYNLSAANERLTELLTKQGTLLEKRQRLLNAPVVNIQRLESVYKTLNKTNDALQKQANIVSRGAGRQLTSSLTAAATAATVAGVAVGSLLTRTAQLANPVAAQKFEYRMKDLGAVVGTITAPAFTALSDSVAWLSRALYNMEPQAKEVLNTILKWGVPIATVAIGLGSVTALFAPMARAGVAAYTALTAAAMRYNAAVAVGQGGAVGGLMSRIPGGALGRIGVAGAAGAAAGGLTGSWAAGLGTTGAIAGGAFFGLPGALIGGGLGAGAGWLIDKVTAGANGPKDPTGLAPQPTQTLTSGLSAGRMFRESSLGMTGKAEQEERQRVAMENLTKQLERLNEKMPEANGGIFGTIGTPEMDRVTQQIRHRDAANYRGFGF